MVQRTHTGRAPTWRIPAVATIAVGLTVVLVAPTAAATTDTVDAVAQQVTATPSAVPVPAADLDITGHPYPRQTPVPVLEADPNDESLLRGALPFHDFAPLFNGWMEASDVVSTEIVGESTQGRPFYLVTITAPETAEENAQQTAWRDAIKHDAEAARQDAELAEGYKVPIWFNNNIHGNEWDGTDASVVYIENLIADVAAGDADALHLVENYRLYFTMSNNPDGRVDGTRATALGLDPNRDNVTNTTPETAIVRDLAAELQPLFFSDLHGYTGALQIEPTGPPHGENYEMDLMMPHSYAAALQIEEDFRESGFLEGRDGLIPHPSNGATPIRIPFRDIRSGWDGWPPIFVAQYVMFQGSIAYTVEFGPGRTDDPVLSQQRLDLNSAVGEMIIDTTLQYVDDNRAELVENQIEIFRRGDAGEPLVEIGPSPDPADFTGPDQWTGVWNESDVYATEFPRAYVIPAGETQSSATDAATLVDMLLAHGVLVDIAEAEFTAGGITYPAGSYIVDMHQPLRGLANVLLADGADISDRVPSMYDISAWSLARLWGATVDRVGSTEDPALTVSSAPVDAAVSTAAFPAGAEYVSLSLDGVAEIQAMNALLEVGVPIADVGDGTFVIGRDGLAAAASASEVFDVEFTVTDGYELLDDDVTAATALTVGYTSVDAGLALDDMGFETVQVSNSFTDYGSLDVLLVNSNLNATPALQEFIAGGGGYVATNSSAGVNLGTGLGILEARRVGSTGGANGIALVDTTEEGVIGATSEPAAFFSGPAYFADLGANVAVEQTWGEYLSGHWRVTGSTPGSEAFVGQPSAISVEAETGARAFVFATQPVYRTHPRGAYPDVAAALLWAGSEEAESPVVAPEAAVMLTPETVEAGQTLTVEGSGFPAGETATITLNPVLGEVVVGVNGTFAVEVRIPADTAAGEYEIVVTSEPGIEVRTPITVTAASEPTVPGGDDEPGDGSSGAPGGTAPGEDTDSGEDTASSGDGDLAFTGTEIAPVLVLALLLLAAGVALAIRRRGAATS